MIVFDRYKSCHVEQVADDRVRVRSSMCDSFHEIMVILNVRIPDGEILDARAEFVRVPDEMCRRTAALMDKLVGVSLGRGIIKASSRYIGGSSGCTHLVDLVIEAAKALLQGQYAIRFRDYTDFETVKNAVSKELEGTCLFHSRYKGKDSEGKGYKE